MTVGVDSPKKPRCMNYLQVVLVGVVRDRPGIGIHRRQAAT
jgi:hypothetical protein